MLRVFEAFTCTSITRYVQTSAKPAEQLKPRSHWSRWSRYELMQHVKDRKGIRRKTQL